MNLMFFFVLGFLFCPHTKKKGKEKQEKSIAVDFEHP